jgi:glycosyltransferase involved in cell wall biosynthesis
MTRGSVLLVANFAPDVGYAWWLMERFWIEVAKACQEHGLRCHVAYPRLTNVPDQVEASGLTPIECDFNDRTVRGVRRQLSVLERLRVRSVYFTDRPFRDARYALFRMAGVRRIVIHDHKPGDRPPLRGARAAVKSALNRITPTTCDRYVALSPLMRERAILNGRVPPSKCLVVQNGIDVESPAAGQGDRAREALELHDDQIAVVNVGRAHWNKGLDFLVQVAAAAVETGLPLTFFHVGDGPLLDECRRQASELGVTSAIRFLGWRSDVPVLLEGCDIAIHPSHGEGFSLSVLEYMRAGLPVVVPDRPSVRQAVVDGVSGMVYPRDDPRAAADAVARLAVDGELRRRMGQSAQEAVTKHYSWSRTRSEFRRVVAYLLGSCAASADEPSGSGPGVSQGALTP